MGISHLNKLPSNSKSLGKLRNLYREKSQDVYESLSESHEYVEPIKIKSEPEVKKKNFSSDITSVDQSVVELEKLERNLETYKLLKWKNENRRIMSSAAHRRALTEGSKQTKEQRLRAESLNLRTKRGNLDNNAWKNRERMIYKSQQNCQTDVKAVFKGPIN